MNPESQTKNFRGLFQSHPLSLRDIPEGKCGPDGPVVMLYQHDQSHPLSLRDIPEGKCSPTRAGHHVVPT